LGEIKYGVLKQVADHFFDIPSMVLPSVLEVLPWRSQELTHPCSRI
jgi:hypothetical protein